MLLRALYEIELNAPLQIADPFNQIDEGNDLDEGADVFRNRSSPQVCFSLGQGVAKLTFHHQFLVDNPLASGHYAPGVKRLTVELEHEFGKIDSDAANFGSEIQETFRRLLWLLVDGRVLPYFKHVRGVPFLRPLSLGNIRSGKFLDENGVVLFESPEVCIVDEYPGRPAKGTTLGCSPVRPSELDDFRARIESPRDFTVVDELRSQAREAIFEKNVLLAVLLLAVSTEVAVKRTFFEPGSDLAERKKPQMLEYLTDKCATVSGIGFNKARPVDYKNIDHLFRCRNRIAHAGKAEFKHVENYLVEADVKVFHEWWESVDVLFAWLHEREQEKPV